MGMNDLETRLSAALHAEADDLSARVDLPAAAAELDTRLDRAGGASRRRTWVVVVAAAAAVAAALAVGVLLNSARHDSAPISPSTSYSTDGYVVPLTFALPDWAAAASKPLNDGRKLVWQQDQCWSDCSAGEDAKLMLLAPQLVFGPGPSDRLVIPSSAAYLAHLDALQAAHLVVLSGSHSTSVDGHPATVLDIATSVDVSGGLGCIGSGQAPPAGPEEGCWSLVAGTHVRLAVIDADTQPYYGSGDVKPPLLILIRSNDGNAQQATYDADLDHVVATTRFVTVKPTYTSTSSVLPFAIVLPQWATSLPPAESQSGRLVTWDLSCERNADCAHPSRQFAVLSPQQPASHSAQASSDLVLALTENPKVTVVGEATPSSVDGRPAQTVTLQTGTDLPGSLGCDVDGSCLGLFAGTTTRVAEITEQGKPPILVWQSWTTGAPNTDTLPADFDKALASMRFGA
jgi:hypothetical protein